MLPSVGRQAGASLIGLSGLLLAAVSLAQDTKTPPAFPVQAEAITVDAVVVDKAGRPVTGLEKSDSRFSRTAAPDRSSASRRAGCAPGEATGAGAPSAPACGHQRGPGARRGRTFAFVLDDLGLRRLHMTYAHGPYRVARTPSGSARRGHASDDERRRLVERQRRAWPRGPGRRPPARPREEEPYGRRQRHERMGGLSHRCLRMRTWRIPTRPTPRVPWRSPNAPPNAECIRPSGSNPGDLAGRVVDRWMATRACQCESATGTAIRRSRDICRMSVAGNARSMHR